MAKVTVNLTLEQATEVKNAISAHKATCEAHAHLSEATAIERREAGRSATILGKALLEFG